MVSRILRGGGYEVLDARDGQGALDVLRNERVDLVLTDVVMPRLDGLGLAAALRASPTPVPVVFMSAYNERGSALLEDERILYKPFESPALLAFVAGCISEAAG